ncbi:class I SAM-dependent methyltransferase [Sphingomonas sp. PAMC 26605]|uniref:class I SAM-dependent methyltransferase n=1 Tax=Sphingomonas sp. PAMC 26605 TaxID=1112214 RepID=UPI00026CAB8A|nr:methyltransferase domain-containing protein [Sphingomonas sp. PAMC 26605]
MTNLIGSGTDAIDTGDILWFHSFELQDGKTIDGVKPLEIQKAEADIFFAGGLEGKAVLDIGAWDGFFSYEAERRGAARVLATDHYCWSGPGWGTRKGFDWMHNALHSSVESLDVDVLSLDPSALGQFDVVLFLGVLYHVKDPYACLEAAARMCSDHLIIETVTALQNEPLPAMRLYKPGELGGDPTNFWAPNLPALELMLITFGFTRIEAVPSPASGSHPLRKNRSRPLRSKKTNSASHRTIIHAWR